MDKILSKNPFGLFVRMECGFTLVTVRAAGCGLVGAGGVLRLCPQGSCYALAAFATRLWLGLHSCGLRYSLTVWALP
jgi:hypothetical protein